MNRENAILRNQKVSEISSLNQQIKTVQSKIITCVEYTMADDVPPYDFKDLHAQAQSARSRIEQLKQEVEALEEQA